VSFRQRSPITFAISPADSFGFCALMSLQISIVWNCYFGCGDSGAFGGFGRRAASAVRMAAAASSVSTSPTAASAASSVGASRWSKTSITSGRPKTRPAKR
jgi:hypothetical protein